ncbi:MAG: hypothetical protein D6696_02470, partial [Acidobacteria bacterium]
MSRRRPSPATRCRALAGALLVALLAAPAGGGEIRLELGRWSGFAELGYDLLDQRDDFDVLPDQRFRRSQWRQRIGLRNSAVIVDRKFLNLSYGITFGLLQSRATANDRRASGDGLIDSFDLTASLLPQHRFSLEAFANRFESKIPQEFTDSLDVVTSNQGLTLKMRRIFLPGVLSLRRSSLQSSSGSEVRARAIDQLRRSLSYEGNRDRRTSQLSLSFKLEDLEDRDLPELSNRSQNLRLRHRLNRGNSLLPGTLTSSLRFFRRRGQVATSSLELNEDLLLEHRDNLRTIYRFASRHLDTQGVETTFYNGRFTVYHKLYESLESTLTLDAQKSTLADGEAESYEGRADVKYRKRLPANGRISARLTSTYGVGDNRFGETELPVAGERHTAQIGLPFRLEQPRVVPGSVVVTDLEGTLIFVQGIDYDLVFAGEFVEITPLPEGQIQNNQQLRVDYRVRVPRMLELSTRSTHFDLRLDYRWIQPFVSFQRIDQTFLGGNDPSFLDDLYVRTAGVQLRLDRPRLKILSRGERRVHESTLLAFEQLSFNHSLVYTPFPSWTLSAGLNQSRSDFTVPLRRTRHDTARLSLRYRPRPSLSVEPFASYRSLEDTLVPDQTLLNAGLRTRLLFGKLELAAVISRTERQRLGNVSDHLRMTLTITRRFSPGVIRTGPRPRQREMIPWSQLIPRQEDGGEEPATAEPRRPPAEDGGEP